MKRKLANSGIYVGYSQNSRLIKTYKSGFNDGLGWYTLFIHVWHIWYKNDKIPLWERNNLNVHFFPLKTTDFDAFWKGKCYLLLSGLFYSWMCWGSAVLFFLRVKHLVVSLNFNF